MVTQLVIIYAMWLILLASVFCDQIADSHSSYCASLDDYYRNKTSTVIPLHGRLRSVFVGGDAQVVEVWGGHGAARAAAALLYVVIRYGLRYNTTLVTKEADLCEFLKRDWNRSAVVAPAAHWPRGGCDTKNYTHIDRFTKLSKPSVQTDLRLNVYTNLESCKHLTWASFADSDTRKNCNFATAFSVRSQYLPSTESLNLVDDCVAILASEEYKKYHDNIVQKYQKLIKGNHEIIFFESDLKLRLVMRSLREKNTPFLFIYDYLWTDFNGTYELVTCNKQTGDAGDTRTSFLVGDGRLTRDFAPDIYNVLSNNSFRPDTKTLRQIMQKESNNVSLEEAACFWANGSSDRFNSFVKIKYNNIEEYLIILLCDRELFINITKTPIRKHINANIPNVRFILRNCSIFNPNNITKLESCLKAISDSTYRIAGVVLGTWTDKIAPVIDSAANKNIFLTFARPVPNENLKTSRSIGGKLFELAQAYHKFFAMSNWYRIAVVSEATDTANSFTEALMSSSNVLWKHVETDKMKIHDTLTKLKNLDARIVILNAEWSLSKKILCVAIELDMTATEHVWITRDRGILECDGQSVDDLKHISIGLEWRGGMTPNKFSIFSRKEWIQSFDKNYNDSKNSSETEWYEFKLPLNVVNMINAIKRLSQAFAIFRNNHFDYIYDLRGETSVSLLASYFDNMTPVNGSTIFIDEWWGNRRRSIAIWQAENETIAENLLLNEIIIKSFSKISDGTKCMIRSGDSFAPRCHDITVILSVIIIILLIIGLVIARRIRLARMVKKDLILFNAIINHRKQIASSLDAYLVERHLVRVLHEIGSGCFGRVHFAELTRPGMDSMVVAAKEPHNDIALDEEREFLHEASILALLSHDHIVRLIGICIKDGPPMVLMEHALYLDLRRYLIERRHLALKVSPTYKRSSYDDISDESLTRFVRQAAAALEYLASRRLVHRDVRAANCLIDKERSLKLADFGMARRLNGSDCEYASHRRALFPVLYMAPESLDQGVFSPASDVWALGVLMLEVVTLGARPFGSWPATRVVRHVSLGGHAPLPPDASIHTRNLAMACWKRDPEDRPSAAKIEHELTVNPQALSAALLSPNPLTEN